MPVTGLSSLAAPMEPMKSAWKAKIPPSDECRPGNRQPRSPAVGAGDLQRCLVSQNVGPFVVGMLTLCA
jgi:hypothetical protein